MGFDTTMPVSPMAYGNNGTMFGNDNGWFAFLIIAMMFGWGNGGNGRNGIGNFVAGETTADQFALQDIKNGIRANGNGICDATYAMAQQAGQTREAITNSGYATTGAIRDLGSQLANCCCETKGAIANLRYDMSKGFGDVVTSGNMNTRDILESNCQNTQRILDALTQAETQRLKEKVHELTLQVSNSAQTQAIVGALKPTPVPAYPVMSPYESMFGGWGNCGHC